MAFTINNRRYTGSKYKIRNWIKSIIQDECLGTSSFCDLFAGTGVVTESVLDLFDTFYINDLLYSNKVIYDAFFLSKDYNFDKVMRFYQKYKSIKSFDIDDNYFSINYGDKFFSYEDSKIIGFIRDDIETHSNQLNKKEYSMLLASLLYSLDRSANTVGHYDAYFRNKKVKSSFRFELITPNIISAKSKCKFYIFRHDANELVKKIRADVVYIDPPYSSRQYSRFYHVLENIVKWDKPELFGTALKPQPENMSEYSKVKAIDYFTELIFDIKSKYIVVSYNNTYTSKSSSSKNKMTLDEIKNVLEKKGNTKVHMISHQAFNAGKTELDDHKEYLFVTKVGDFNE